MNWILVAYIALAVFAAFGLFTDYTTSMKFYKPDEVGGAVHTSEGNKFWRKKDGTFNSGKYLIMVAIIAAFNGVMIFFRFKTGQVEWLLAAGVLDLFVGLVFWRQGAENKRKMKLAAAKGKLS